MITELFSDEIKDIQSDFGWRVLDSEYIILHNIMSGVYWILELVVGGDNPDELSSTKFRGYFLDPKINVFYTPTDYIDDRKKFVYGNNLSRFVSTIKNHPDKLLKIFFLDASNFQSILKRLDLQEAWIIGKMGNYTEPMIDLWVRLSLERNTI